MNQQQVIRLFEIDVLEQEAVVEKAKARIQIEEANVSRAVAEAMQAEADLSWEQVRLEKLKVGLENVKQEEANP